jgi:hypothetical protein
MNCDVCGRPATHRIQYRESERSTFDYCAAHVTGIIQRHNRGDFHLYKLRMLT